MVPNCSVEATDREIAFNTTYGTVLGETTVDVELVVQAWADTQFDAGTDQEASMAFCLRSDVVIVNGASDEVLYRRKHFIFHVQVLTSAFTVNEPGNFNLGAVNSTSATDSEDKSSGTTLYWARLMPSCTLCLMLLGVDATDGKSRKQ
jgi:hypothetical protein